MKMYRALRRELQAAFPPLARTRVFIKPTHDGSDAHTWQYSWHHRRTKRLLDRCFVINIHPRRKTETQLCVDLVHEWAHVMTGIRSEKKPHTKKWGANYAKVWHFWEAFLNKRFA